MPDGHNWNQLHYFLLSIGFKQIIDPIRDIIRYKKDEQYLLITKSNDMSCEYLQSILDYIGVTYDEFKLGYEEAYKQHI